MTDRPPLARSFLRIGLLSFGGPAAQIALMHREAVERHGWLSEEQFLRSLGFCMMLPGPEAMQLATYIGWRLRGIAGGLIAGILFTLPGALVIALLAALYAAHGTRPETASVMLGVKAAVIVIVAQAVLRLGAKALKGKVDIALAALSFVGLFVLGLPFPLILGAAALWGALRPLPQDAAPPDPSPGGRTSPATLLVWAALWLAPLPILHATGQTLLFEMGAFFAKLAVLTFGGAYAVLAWMAQEVVDTRHWLDATQMIDALGLAETTPGPLILVTQFVGQLTGHQAGGLWLGLAAGALTLWMTFVPCFLWIFAGAPHVEALTARPRLRAALAAITAAVTGVIANLALWFAIHTLFAQTTSPGFGPDLPVPDSLRWQALPLIALAALLLGPLKRGVPLVLPICAAAGWGLGPL